MAKQHHNSQPTLAEVSTSELTLEFQAHQPKSNQQVQREREREREGERETERERERERVKNSTVQSRVTGTPGSITFPSHSQADIPL